jgi:hypothetical protein
VYKGLFFSSLKICAEHPEEDSDVVFTPFAGIILCRFGGFNLSLIFLKHPGNSGLLKEH